MGQASGLLCREGQELVDVCVVCPAILEVIRDFVCNIRVIATSLVSPVSTGPLFSSPVALASLVSTIARWTPTQGPKAHRWHVETCKMTANSAKNSFGFSFQQLSILPSEQLVSQASSGKGVVCEISEQLESQKQYCMIQWAERVDILTCETLLSGLQEASYWTKNGLRSQKQPHSLCGMFHTNVNPYVCIMPSVLW